jgi:hypothetical protein
MERPARRPNRRTVLKGVGASLVPLAAGRGSADPVSELVEEAVSSTPKVFGEVGRRINTVRYPLVGVPAVREPGETLRVELDADPDEVAATLSPSFGAARPETALTPDTLETERSRIWGDEEYAVARFEVPTLDEQFTEGLYDLEVSVDGQRDGQPRAVSVHRSFPSEPQVAIMGDPHVGDPRPLQDGAQRSFEEQTPDPFLFRYQETVGTGTDRWGAFKRANAELNLQDPDIVIVIGDLTFGSANYFQEYEDAYGVLNGIEAPTFVTVGNHDGYVTPGAGIDGKALWRRYFAPWHYSVDIRPDLHFVSIDSYDWPAIDRIAPSAVPSTWGGQVRDPQLSWLDEDLRSWRAANPDGTIMTLSHHNPSWEQTEGGELSRYAEGTPGAEQLARGVERSGGGWVGTNRLAVRNLLEEVGVTLHMSGHAHRDRLARVTDFDGNESSVVATTGSGLEHVTAETGESIDSTTATRRSVLADGDGPLYVEATTAASGTTQYWGWRTVPLARDRLDPTEFGYPVTETFLDDRALDPSLWTTENADLGLYSTPSYLLETETQEATGERVVVDIDSGLERDFSGAVTLPLDDCPAVRVRGGRKLWRRRGETSQDVRVAFEVPAGDSVTVTAECVSESS